MKYYEARTTKDGRKLLLRNTCGADAAEVLSHLKQTSSETDYMLRYSDEIRMSEEAERAFLSETEQSGGALNLGAFLDGVFAGSAGLTPVFCCDKCGHRAEFGLSVKKEFWNMGIGSALLCACLSAARKAGYQQVELEVVSDNTPAIALYEKFGFQTYGKLEQGFRLRSGKAQTLLFMVCRL